MTDHFSDRDARCRCGCGNVGPRRDVERTAQRLETLRAAVGHRPLKVSSWYRCPDHPAESGKLRGALHRHTTGRAVDIHCRGELRFRILEKLRKAGFRSLGIYRWGLHLDWVEGDVSRFWIG